MAVLVSPPGPQITPFAGLCPSQPSLYGCFQRRLAVRVPEGLHFGPWSSWLPGCGAKGDESAAHREPRRLRRARPGVTWLLFPPQQDFGQVTSLLGFLISNWP